MRPRRLTLRGLDGLELSTPALLTATRGGAVPNLSKDSIELIHEDGKAKENLLLPFNYLAKNSKVLKAYGKGNQSKQCYAK